MDSSRSASPAPAASSGSRNSSLGTSNPVSVSLAPSHSAQVSAIQQSSLSRPSSRVSLQNLANATSSATTDEYRPAPFTGNGHPATFSKRSASFDRKSPEEFRLNLGNDGPDGPSPPYSRNNEPNPNGSISPVHSEKAAFLTNMRVDDTSNGKSGKTGMNAAMGTGVTYDHIMNHPALPVACYCLSSILMTVVNKFVLSGAHFSMNFLLLTIQSTVCIACVTVCKRLRLITFRDFDRQDARAWFPISFMLVMVIYTGSKALQYLPIPVVSVCKNLTIILIAYGEVLWFSGSVTGLIMCSFGLMILSSLIAGWADISHALQSLSEVSAQTTLDPVTGAEIPAMPTSIPDITAAVGQLNAGYLWMAINVFVSAGYVLAMRKRIKVTNFKDWDSMYYNNLLSIPVLVFFSLLIEDWSAKSLEANFPAEGRYFLLFAMVFSGAAAVFISYTTAWCVRTTSSTTYSMVGALNKLPVAASGMVFFGDPITTGSVGGVLTGFVAGLVYALAKANQAAAKKLGMPR
ncbi:uncharacterized protein L969DRAFT_85250 [Mixia osmundae IAM 14324]|uniref:GDP-mannose transporter n=1 Tax=Mixia osmundae (strain CBS 9802 / IAM 14324 / JCM 22182 / KY 12970) TaxID=764103 RepID=G7DYA3_MIXOS|nr:uncharacterized protein L969DRAFT_85250 [Mixia osmundae IAM 14324]KEI41465.1 hypothetical protein L969DRAFT_85250 [Mixia osmundae IAM 14324]GAA95563.1 hypothetical protein E5Q_02218 [Mixia osmundae IAM 14324]